MRIAIVENTAITHHGQVGVALHEAAARVEIFRPWRDGALPDPGDHDALVVFGGEQSALDDARHPYLPRLAALMRQTSDSGRAVLGICLGAQVLARAFGAENRLGAAREFGWTKVRLTDEGRADPVLGVAADGTGTSGATGTADGFAIFQWHSDTFSLPPGAVHLAASATAAQQAFRIGRATYGTQFHFEASRAVVADWSRSFPDLVEVLHPGWRAAHPVQAETRGVQADATGLAMARAWVALV